ncbi:hypothetical protein B807_355 [Fructilactobacillus florum 2F]|nr:hypothetical protein B807_355 [Fructilactobacillus florum 2F]
MTKGLANILITVLQDLLPFTIGVSPFSLKRDYRYHANNQQK